MRTKSPGRTVFLASLIAFGMLGDAAAAPEPTESVTVTAPYRLRKDWVGPLRAPLMVATISQAVSYRDLDLKSDAGVETLEARVRQTADEICRELDRRFPKTVYAPVAGGQNCSSFAARTGLIEVHEIVRTVRGRG